MSDKLPAKKLSSSSTKETEINAESLLTTLDQLSQTMDIMSKVIIRLRTYLHGQLDNETQELLEECEDSFSKITPPSSKGHTLH